MIPHLLQVLGEQPFGVLAWTFFWGVLWGFGGLTYGLTMRYLGLSLGTAIILGITALFGTYVPPLFEGTLGLKLHTIAGQVIVIGSAMALMGIMLSAASGMSKEKEMSEDQKRKVIQEFNLRKGILVAIFSGVMSSCFAFGLASGIPISTSALHYGASEIWTGLPKIIVVVAGGFTTNLVWCLYLAVKNRSLHQLISRAESTGAYPETKNAANPGEERNGAGPSPVPLIANYLFSGLAGTLWYFQFFFYTMGETQMGSYRFSSWTLHMASIIIFGSLWGIVLKEWENTSGLSKFLLALSIFALVGATIVVGYGNLLGIQIGGK